jgi:hypothetical protein
MRHLITLKNTQNFTPDPPIHHNGGKENCTLRKEFSELAIESYIEETTMN